MSASQTAAQHSTALPSTFDRRILAGVLGGLAGGVVFGMLMAMMGLLTTIASMVGSTSAWVGFAMHLMLSVLIGLGLTILFGNRLLTGYGRGTLVGMAYGAIWWVLGPLVMMPLMLGMPVFSMDITSVLSLMGHLIYGAILGLTAVRVLKNRA
ncbi:putative membrane protein YagU involved in acid resistance [Cryobacterium sp. CAN_C3]|uniref:hypothetical protein n=1 Tax=unclassified Cryobacterium TaxID=2649013 RepID=UPI001A275FD4|nr:putative membrane protein YagU involved in acid resistance [Cryobacterium sp. CAN_C3]